MKKEEKIQLDFSNPIQHRVKKEGGRRSPQGN